MPCKLRNCFIFSSELLQNNYFPQAELVGVIEGQNHWGCPENHWGCSFEHWGCCSTPKSIQIDTHVMRCEDLRLSGVISLIAKNF